MPKQVYDGNLFRVDMVNNDIQCTFKSAANTNVFMQMDFFSKLLSSYIPDNDGVWRPGERTNYEIVGWPKGFIWKRTGEKTVVAKSLDAEVIDAYKFAEVLEKSFTNIVNRTEEEDGGAYYHFSIVDETNVYEYSFNDRARVVAVLCVLYDLDSHPRSHLEINIPHKYVSQQKWPVTDGPGDNPVRYYGDPSKTADVLRNEGWTREGQDAHMFVIYQVVNGQRQQTYKIDTREQTRNQQVKRTAIKPVWRNKLFAAQDYTCRICLNKYPVGQLSPDHRIPVIFAPDNLTDDNYDKKLMTLCRFCNQQKREFTKRIGADYDWETSPWAYPEKFLLKRIQNDIKEYAKQNHLSNIEVAKLLAENFQTPGRGQG